MKTVKTEEETKKKEIISNISNAKTHAMAIANAKAYSTQHNNNYNNKLKKYNNKSKIKLYNNNSSTKLINYKLKHYKLKLNLYL